jgi:hypothetical protein
MTNSNEERCTDVHSAAVYRVSQKLVLIELFMFQFTNQFQDQYLRGLTPAMKIEYYLKQLLRIQ